MPSRTNWKKLLRQIHYWLSLVVAVPLIIVIVSGFFLMWKKEVAWIQPPTARGVGDVPAISFDAVLAAAAQVEEAGIHSWDDVDRLDVRPDKGVVKVRGHSRWEVQVDTATAEILHVAFRRSDLIESIHDGSFFHALAKHWIFFPAGVVLFVMWITGIYLFILPIWMKQKKQRTRAASNA